MTDSKVRSFALHPITTFVMRFSLALAIALLGFYIIPGFEMEAGHRSLIFRHSTVLTPVIVAFLVLLAVGLVLFGWRARVRSIGS